MNHFKTLMDLYRLKKNVNLSTEKMRSLQDGSLRKLLRFVWEHETEHGASRERIRQEMLKQMGEILSEKNLDYVQFYVNFVDEILPDIRTGKKPLILKGKAA